MKNDDAFEALLRDSLDRSGRPAPFAIDVADAVMARVSTFGPPPRSDLSLRQFGWWAAAASVVGVALTAAAASQAPSLWSSSSGLLHTMADALGVAVKLVQPAGSLAGTLGRVAVTLVSSARSLVQPLQPLQPLAQVVLVAIAAAMLTITTIVVGRDVRARVADKERA
jgi:hypothetical protein